MASRSSILPYLRRAPLLWVGAFLLLLSLVFGAIGGLAAIQWARFAAEGETAEGIVLSKDIKHANSSSSTSYLIRYRFTAPNDQAYEGSSTIDGRDWERLAERDPIMVQYVVSDPSSNRLLVADNLIVDVLFLVLFLSVEAGLVPICGYLVWRESRTLREDRRLLRVGLEARATVAAVEPTNLSINKRLQWAISYAYRDGGGKDHEGRSWMMAEAEARVFSPGDHATILYDPDRPARSLWIHGARPAGSASQGPKESRPLEHGESPAGTSTASRARAASSAPDAIPDPGAPPSDQPQRGD